ncbi:hypothetical protein [Facilibium subflavum]|uniref:hypothetical protein n=1 Tax=Facilibium subflavum TaxID=2219058 RepID=UPI000E648BC6|nr:hypothetical protein [Facilibium subflavum]
METEALNKENKSFSELLKDIVNFLTCIALAGIGLAIVAYALYAMDAGIVMDSYSVGMLVAEILLLFALIVSSWTLYVGAIFLFIILFKGLKIWRNGKFSVKDVSPLVYKMCENSGWAAGVMWLMCLPLSATGIYLTGWMLPLFIGFWLIMDIIERGQKLKYSKAVTYVSFLFAFVIIAMFIPYRGGMTSIYAKISNLRIDSAFVVTDDLVYKNATVLNSQADPLPIRCGGDLLLIKGVKTVLYAKQNHPRALNIELVKDIISNHPKVIICHEKAMA